MPKGKFAKNTTVPEEQTRVEIEQVLTKYGATGYGAIHEGGRWRLLFKIQGHMLQMDFVTPKDDYSRKDAIGRIKPQAQQKAAWEQEKRSFWRAIYNVIKFKLEAIAIGYSTIEREFLADILLPDGSKIWDWLHPQLDIVYKTGKMPPMLPRWGDADKKETVHDNI